ncbi:hypothetical protein [Marimonas lutisalis]|uniref:hypothetical protein n=1 Tax=Marimonas lutisalis TaxID=2545756 RepID=UPI0010F614FB|nr:hypothetical protein [Marimonas lutisalis]
MRPKDTSDPTRRVRAGLIRYLLRGGCDGEGGARPHPKGVALWGAWIDGALDFEGCETSLDLTLAYCRFPDQLVFQNARLGGLYLTGSRCARGLELHRLETETDVHLRDGFASDGLVDLGGARIGGQLTCRGGRFDGDGSLALNGDALMVEESLYLSDGFNAKGQVKLGGTRIGGQVVCSGGRFDGGGGRALYGDSMEVGASLLPRAGFEANGEVTLRGARIGGQVACSGGRFDGGGGRALYGDSMEVGASLLLRDGFEANGEVNLRGARIGGQLSCVGGRFDGGEGRALTSQALEVGADVFLRLATAEGKGTARACHLSGRVDFSRARIGGNLRIEGARIEGIVDLESARIEEGFYWQGVKGDVEALDLTEVRLGVLRDDAESWKTVQNLRLGGLQFDSVQSQMGIAERLDWLDRKLEWPLPEEMKKALEHQPWLEAAPDGFDPQPYTQLAKVLEAQGNRGGAARVLEVRERKVRAAAQRRAAGRIDGSWRAGVSSLPAVAQAGWDTMFRWLFGYGHAPARALLWVAGIWVFCYWLYGNAYAAGQMAPASDVVLTSGDWGRALKAGCTEIKQAGCDMPLHLWAGDGAGKKPMPTARDYETFSPALYALDLFVPLDALGQENAWAPSKDRGWWGWWGYWMRWAVQVMGWIITAVGAAVVTGLIGRKE